MISESSAESFNGQYSESDISRIIQMAWEDRTPFEAIESQFALNESAVVRLMRKEMKASSFKMWRKRMNARTTKHLALRKSNQNKECSNQQDVEQRSCEG